MIQVQELLYIDAADFFKHIAESVAYDISEATGKKVRVKQLHKGFSYKKTMKNKVGRKGEVDINITAMGSTAYFQSRVFLLWRGEHVKL